MSSATKSKENVEVSCDDVLCLFSLITMMLFVRSCFNSEYRNSSNSSSHMKSRLKNSNERFRMK